MSEDVKVFSCGNCKIPLNLSQELTLICPDCGGEVDLNEACANVFICPDYQTSGELQ